ncbi:MAG: SHOCT domain-containing protein [Promethearchaeota archaeon]
MSDVSSGLIKLAYRGIAGFFVLLFMFVFGAVGIALGFAGGLVTALSWIPLAYPEILTQIPVITVGQHSVTDPVLAFLVVLLTGIILLAVGFFFLALTYMIGKGAIIVDKELASIVDKAFSGKDRVARLERLAALRDRGVLTEKEFDREKALILEQE